MFSRPFFTNNDLVLGVIEGPLKSAAVSQPMDSSKKEIPHEERYRKSDYRFGSARIDCPRHGR